MMKFNDYESFLLESKANLVRNSEELIVSILDAAKKEKVIKYYGDLPRSRTSGWREFAFSHIRGNRLIENVLLSRMFIFEMNKKFFGVFAEEKDLKTPGKFLKSFTIISEGPFEKGEIEKVFTSSVEANNGKLKISCTKDSISIDLKYFTLTAYSGRQTKEKLYSCEITYSIEISEGETVSFDEMKKLPEFQNILKKYPLEVISTPAQLKKGSVILAIPANLVIDTEEKYVGKKYLNRGFGIYNSGYIRLVYAEIRETDKSYGTLIPSATMWGKFDASSESGWKEGFKMLDDKIEKFLEKLKKEDIIIISTPEEREKYRGLITGRKFGI